MEWPIRQPLIFILGKGGVGRTSVTTALGCHFAEQGESVLLVQWNIRDYISPIFGQVPAGHEHQEILPNLSVMNFDPKAALRDYFVKYLGMKLFYRLVLENQQVQRLVHSAPGLEELLFLGRLYWLLEKAEEEEGLRFDRVIVDSPATGHGAALFSIASAMSRLPMVGPLTQESARVAGFLADPTKVGLIPVTLPEELPVEETLELIPRLIEEIQKPLFLVINRSLSSLGLELPGVRGTYPRWFSRWEKELADESSQAGARALWMDLERRIRTEADLREKADLPLLSLPDIMIESPGATARERIEALSRVFAGPGAEVAG